MRKILLSNAAVVTVLAVIFAGDFFRNALTVWGWGALALLAMVWGYLVVIRTKVSWRAVPLPFLLFVLWAVASVSWSVYSSTAALGAFILVGSVVCGIALAVSIPFDHLVHLMARTLRIILAGSVVFEIGVALTGRPLFPVGFTPTATTPIEFAWSRGHFFEFDQRIQGLVGNANLLGMLAVLALLMALARFRSGRGTRSRTIADFALSGLIVWHTYSATVVFILIAVSFAAFIIYLGRHRANPTYRAALVMTIGGGTMIVALILLNWPLVASLLGKTPDFTNRLDIWLEVMARSRDMPLLGHGFVGFWPDWEPYFGFHYLDGKNVGQAHNAWLDIVLQVGAVGLVLFLFALGQIVWRLFQHAIDDIDPLHSLPLLLLTAQTVQTLTESRILTEWGIVLFALWAAQTSKQFEHQILDQPTTNELSTPLDASTEGTSENPR